TPVAETTKSTKRDKASAKRTRGMAAKHATPKKAKSKVQRTGRSAKKPVAMKKRPPDTAQRRQVAKAPVETTIIDAIEEPVPSVVAVTQYESVPTATSILPGGEPERGEGIGPAGTST